MKTNIFLKKGLFVAVIAAIVATGCQPDEVSAGSAMTQGDPDASFSLQQDASGNHVIVAGATDSEIQYHTWRWYNPTDASEDSGEIKGDADNTYFFPDAGTYKIQHRVVGYTGGANSISEQTVTVSTPDPVAGNLILNGKFTDGQGAWQILNISSSNAEWTFNGGQATITVSGSNQQAIYQPVEVVAGQQYKVDMKVSGSGSTNTWFEVYVSPTAPTQGSDYSANGIRLQLNTWAGCATSSFSGMLSEVGCGGSGNPMTFTQSGTVYVVIKSGGENSTINVDNVEFRRVTP